MHRAVKIRIFAVVGTWALLCLVTQAAISDQPLPVPHNRLTRLVTGWLPYWLNKDGTGDGWKTVSRHLDMIDQVSFFDAEVDEQTGAVTPKLGAADPALNQEIATLHSSNIQALVTVTLMKDVHLVMNDPASLQKVSDGIVALLNRYNFDGIDIDFEDFKDKDPADAARYTQFMSDLSTRLHKRPDSFGFPTTVGATVLARTQRGDFSYADETALANSGLDQVRVMAYDDYYPGSKTAGADAPLPWVLSVAQYLRDQRAPTWKFLVGVPAYGDKWPVTSPSDWTTAGHGVSVS